jgi:hypothetical protein
MTVLNVYNISYRKYKLSVQLFCFKDFPSKNKPHNPAMIFLFFLFRYR